MIEIGKVSWTQDDMRQMLQEFSHIYEKRPIHNNVGGMQPQHMFLSYFLMKTLNPKAIIESGVWFGQGTWLFEQACPQAELHCIDLNLKRICYKSKRATYYNQDFSKIKWTGLQKEETVLFFDDHQNAYRRLITAKEFGFSHLIFEDNYPPSAGDCYSLKKVLAHAGHSFSVPFFSKKSIKEKLKWFLKGVLLPGNKVLPNSIDAEYLKQNLEIYYECPPIFKFSKTRWGGNWDDYETPQPLLTAIEEPYQKVFFDKIADYNWMCYAKLKQMT